MSVAIKSFCVGSLYSNEQIYQSLGVGNAGGIRSKMEGYGRVRRLVIMTSLPDSKMLAENPYHDRIEGNVLVYTAAGRVGDQAIAGQNAKIPKQALEFFPIWGFQQQTSRRDRSSGPHRWKFLGLLQYLRLYSENQFDTAGATRSAFIFEFLINNLVEEIAVDQDSKLMAELIANSTDENRLDENDREVVSEEEESFLTHGMALEEVRSHLLNQEPRQFELTVSKLLSHSGFRDVEVTRYSQDGGIDINAKPGDAIWPMKHLLLQVQAKRWLHTVGRREVAELRGSMLPHSMGCIVTTSHFSRTAMNESSSDGKVPIQLVNGLELARLLQNAGFGV